MIRLRTYSGPMGLVTSAREIAESLLAETLPRRWSHVQAVASKAGEVASVVDDADRQILVAAAWLHDVGYAPGIAICGLHALDGARWLRSQGCDARVAALVA